MRLGSALGLAATLAVALPGGRARVDHPRVPSGTAAQDTKPALPLEPATERDLRRLALGWTGRQP